MLARRRDARQGSVCPPNPRQSKPGESPGLLTAACLAPGASTSRASTDTTVELLWCAYDRSRNTAHRATALRGEESNDRLFQGDFHRSRSTRTRVPPRRSTLRCPRPARTSPVLMGLPLRRGAAEARGASPSPSATSTRTRIPCRRGALWLMGSNTTEGNLLGISSLGTLYTKSCRSCNSALRNTVRETGRAGSYIRVCSPQRKGI